MRTIEDMKRDALKIGGASERAYGLKIAVSYEATQRMYFWTVNDVLANEQQARDTLQRINDTNERGGAWPAAFGR
jgi:hypothetical protein